MLHERRRRRAQGDVRSVLMFATAVVGYGPFASATYLIRSVAVKEFRGAPPSTAVRACVFRTLAF